MIRAIYIKREAPKVKSGISDALWFFVLSQYCTEYLKLDQASEFYKYMTICADATDKGKSDLSLAFIKLTQHVDLR